MTLMVIVSPHSRYSHQRAGRRSAGCFLRRAFTLVELLIIISILSLLMSILVPTLSRSKELARRVVCASHIRALISACLTYAGEHRERLPYLHIGNTPSSANPSPYWLLRKQVNTEVLTTDEERKACFSFNYNLTREHFYCPSNGPGWNRDDFWVWPDSTSSVVGYPYFGGNRILSVQGALRVSYSPVPDRYPVFPMFSSQEAAYGVLFADLTRLQPDGSWFGPDRRGVNHFRNAEPEGQNVGMVDNSVVWHDWPNYRGFLNNGGWLVHF